MKTICVPERVVRSYASSKGISLDEALRHFEELAKFLEICAGEGRRCAPSVALDEPWHHFMQFSRDYREFCMSEYGKFIDHDPSPVEQNVEAYLRTRETAAVRFGDLDPVFWPVGPVGATCCGSQN